MNVSPRRSCVVAGGTGARGVVPHPERGLAYVNSEHCCQGADHASVIDIRDPGDLRLISVFPRPRALARG